MPYAHIVDGQLVEIRDELPRSARRLDTGQVVFDLVKWGPATGWFPTEHTVISPDSQRALYDQMQAATAARTARHTYINQVAVQARQAVAGNAAIRAGNDQFRTAVAAFLAAEVPATTAERLVFLYTSLRSLANGVAAITETIDAVTHELDGVIRLLGNAVPALSDLLDQEG